MNIVYLITHRERLKNNLPPYYYIGSKYNWKGAGTYYGSSSHPIMKESKPADLDFEILFWFDECTHQYLIDFEKKVQKNLNVLKDVKYFNMSYACTSVTSDPDKIKRRKEAFSKIANSYLPTGQKYSEFWASKAKHSWDAVGEDGLTRRQRDSIKRREWMLSEVESGELRSEYIMKKTKATNLKVGEDGLTGYKRQGKLLSEWLNSVDENTGVKNSLLRLKNNPALKRVEVLGVCFYSKAEACRFLGIAKTTLATILNNEATILTYKVLLKVFDKEYLDKFLTIKPLPLCEKFSICGVDFNSKREARAYFKMPQTSFELLVKTGKPNKSIKRILVNHFGEEVYKQYYE